MKRLLGMLFLVLAFIVSGFADYWSFKPANLKINIPSGWFGLMFDDYMVATLDLDAEHNDIILSLNYYSDRSFGEHSWEKEYELLESEFEQFKNIDLEVKKTDHKEINGMQVASIEGTYYDEYYGGNAIYLCMAIDTGKGLSMLSIYVVEDKIDQYQDIIDEIIHSIEKI